MAVRLTQNPEAEVGQTTGSVRETQNPEAVVDSHQNVIRLTQQQGTSVDSYKNNVRLTQVAINIIMPSAVSGGGGGGGGGGTGANPCPPGTTVNPCAGGAGGTNQAGANPGVTPCPPATVQPNCLCAPQNVSSIKINDIVKTMRAYPEFVPIFGTTGWEQEPAVSIANDIMQEFFASNMDWKFNRSFVAPFLTVGLQQDYIGVSSNFCPLSVLDLGWLEQGWLQDVFNTTNPKPVYAAETVRDLARTSFQSGRPFNISWVPIPLAIYGQWQASTVYNTAYPTTTNFVAPVSQVIQQFIDANGNFLYVSGSGTSGTVQPVASPGAAPGTTLTDGTVTWTVADPRGVAIRLSPLPAFAGITWMVTAVYQRKPPIITSLADTLNPIPNEFSYLFRQGFHAFLKRHAGAKDSGIEYEKWQATMIKALRSVDREREEANFYPSAGLSEGDPWGWGPFPAGPGWPYFFPPY